MIHRQALQILGKQRSKDAGTDTIRSAVDTRGPGGGKELRRLCRVRGDCSI